MTELESVKNAQRLHHIILAVQRRRTVQNDLHILEDAIPRILGGLTLPSDFIPPELPSVEL